MPGTSDGRPAISDRATTPAFGRWPRVARFRAIRHPLSAIQTLRPLFLIAASVAVFAQLAVVRSVLIGRAPASSPGRSARLAEIAWVVLPTVALLIILVVTWRALGSPVALAPVNGVTA